MKKDLMPDYQHKPSSREYLVALTNFTSYCKLINVDGKAYKNLINWIIINGPQLRDSNEKFPDLKEIALLTNTPYNNIAKYLRDIYNDICSLNNDNPKAFADGSQKIYEIMFNYLGCYGYFNLGLENIPREGERFDFYFIQPKVGSSRFWVKDVQHEIIDGRQIITLRVTHEDPNLYLRLLREKAHLNGELDWREYYGFLRYDTEKRLVKLYRNL